MRLISVYGNSDSPAILYKLLEERPEEAWISHSKMPSREMHEHFIANIPFFRWYLIEVEGKFVGALECNDRNELGVAVLKQFQRKGYAREALALFMRTHTPLHAIPAKRNGHWLANVSTQNRYSKEFFKSMGFRPLQETLIREH